MTVQAVHHGAELSAHGCIVVRCSRSEAGIGHKEGQGVVAPVVGQAALDQMALSLVQVHRQQAQRRDAQALVVRQHGGAGHTGEPAALRKRHLRVQRGQGLDLRLVENGFGQRGLRPRRDGSTGAQFGGQIEHTRLGHVLRVVLCVGLIRRVGTVAALQRQRGEWSAERACPGVDQEARRVEALPGLRRPGSVRAQTVKLANAQARHKAVPDTVAAGRQTDARGLGFACGVEQAEFDGAGVACIDRCVESADALADAGRDTHRPGSSRRAAEQVGFAHGDGSSSNQTTASGGRFRHRDWA